MLVEVKSRQKAYQKATKQLLDGKERLEEIFSILGMTTAWQYIGVFFALEGDGTPLFDCEKCSTFGIIGEELIPQHLVTIEEEVAKKNENWNPADHVEEFVELAKQVLFIDQGDRFAPVTGSNIINKTVKHLNLASTVENIFYWTQQLSFVFRFWAKRPGSQVETVPEPMISHLKLMNILYCIFDDFCSMGGSRNILSYLAKRWEKKGNVVHYFVFRTCQETKSKLPLTLMLECIFGNVAVKETSFDFNTPDSLPKFMELNGIEPDHHVIFDNLVIKNYSANFFKCFFQCSHFQHSFLFSNLPFPAFISVNLQSFARNT